MPDINVYFFVSPVLGAVIGYITNWVAIKMLFRPHSEKFIFGKKLPFTPGLIPSRRYILAKKVGETISKHLLTDDTLIKSLCGGEVKRSFEAIIDNILESIKKSDKTLGEVLFGDRGETALQEGVSAVSEKLSTVINSDGFLELLTDYEKRILNSDRAAKDLLPESVLSGAKQHICQNAGYMSGKLLDALDSPFYKEEIKPVILKIIEGNVKGLASLFITPEKIYDNLINSVYEYLSDPDNYEATADKLNYAFDKLLLVRMSDFAGALTNGEIGLISSMIKQNNDFDKDAASDIGDMLKDKIIGIITNSVMPVKLSYLFSIVGINLFETVKKEIISKYDVFIITHMPGLISALNMPHLIEEKINEFEIEEAEDIIISVVDRELKAITYFGGILGFLIGIGPPLLQLLGFK